MQPTVKQFAASTGLATVRREEADGGLGPWDVNGWLRWFDYRRLLSPRDKNHLLGARPGNCGKRKWGDAQKCS